MDVQNITLDLSKTIMVGQIVRMGQEDRGGTTIRATILDNSAVPSISGASAEFCMRLPDGIHYVRDANCTVSGNVITYVVDEEHCCSVAGYTDEAYFNLISGSTTYSTTRFRVKVERSVTDGSTPGEVYDSEINQAIQRAIEAAEAAEEAAGEVPPLMSATKRGGAKLGDGLALTDEKLNVDPLTTAEIDTVVADGSLTSSKVLTGTRLTYLWSKLKQKFASLVDGVVAVSQGGTGGTTALDARKNLAVPVDSSIAYVESTTAQANHAVGDYFMLGSVLMRATAAIAAGETINASKATPATVQGQIDTLRDSVAYNSEIVSLTGISSGQVRASRFGRIVSLQFESITLPNNLGDGNMVDIGTIPARYRPATGTFCLCIASTSETTGKIRIAIRTGGSLNIRNVSGTTVETNNAMSSFVAYMAAS